MGSWMRLSLVVSVRRESCNFMLATGDNLKQLNLLTNDLLFQKRLFGQDQIQANQDKHEHSSFKIDRFIQIQILSCQSHEFTYFSSQNSLLYSSFECFECILMTIYTQFRYWLQFLLITMSNRQNYDPNASIHRYPSLVLATDQDLEADNPLLNASSFDNELGNSKGNNFIDRLDFLVADSLRTISRGSLDICPQAPSMDINTNIQEEIPSTLKSSRKSLIFEEPEEPQEQKQLNLIAKTDELSLNGGEQDLEADIFSAYSPKKHRALVKTQRPKIHHISQPKQLIRQLKREHKYNDSIIADIVIAVDNKISKLKHANMKPIISDKGHLSGLIIVSADNQFKVRVVNQKGHIFDPKLQLWDQDHQEWMQFDFKVKIRNA